MTAGRSAPAGTIIATTDGGASWAAQSSPTGNDLFSVTFADANHGWAVGDRGRILATTDGGAVWTAQSSPTTGYLNGVTCIGPLRAWAVGEKGVILATTDGGAHWLVRRAPKADDLYTVAFADRRHGWAVGVGGVILATTNGGAAWRVQHCPTEAGSHLGGLRRRAARFRRRHRRHDVDDHARPAGPTCGRRPVVRRRRARRAGTGARCTSAAARELDGPGGSGVASIQYSLDHGKTWTTGSSFTFAAPADHSSDGAHTFLYPGDRQRRQRRGARTGRVRIDTRRPVPSAPGLPRRSAGARGLALRCRRSAPRQRHGDVDAS